MRSKFEMNKILVTGGSGMLGSDLCPILEQSGYNVLKTNSKTLDITDFNMTNNVINEFMPDVIIHCAAYTNVEKAQEDLQSVKNVNEYGTENISKICNENDIVLMYISTDYVFDGNKKTPYTKSDLPNPLNNYGLTKFHGEQLVQKYCKKFYICRTSWLYGHNGKNFVETMLNLATKNQNIKVVDDQIGCPTWTVDLSHALVDILRNKDYGIYNTCGGGETSWYGFAKEIFKLADLNVNLSPCTSVDFKQKATRPKYSVMDNENLCRNWQDAIKDYMNLYHSK